MQSSVREPWAKSCKKQISTVCSWGAAFNFRPHPWFLPKQHLQLYLYLTITSWLNFPAWPWTCLLSMDVSGELDSCWTLVTISRLCWSWYSLENHPMADLGTSFTAAADRARLQGWAQVMSETIPTGGIPQPWSHHLVSPNRLSVSRLGGSCVRVHAMIMVSCQRLYRHRQSDLQS